MFERSNAAWFFWLVVCFVFIGIALAFDAIRKGATTLVSWVWVVDALVTVVLAFVLVLVAYATSEWSLKAAAVAMLVTAAVVIVAGIRYLDWRQVQRDTPSHLVVSQLGALSDGQAFARDEAAREAMRQRLSSFSGNPRGPARLVK
jgi:glucan phosphoethanolaminetransferase (alkaline phosphatase superfamily)